MGNEDSLFDLEALKVEHLKAAQIDKQLLIDIYLDYMENQEILKQQAEYFGNILHLGKEVNSIRQRVKEPLSLLVKIVRKRKEAIEKDKKSPYLDISVDNYKSIISDLVGIRAIYLFKENWLWVNDFILKNFDVCKKESITIYHAADDDLDFYKNRESTGKEYVYELIEKDSRYRSTHYIIKGIKPHIFNFELQTRTILDEAWGEIDHYIRYPNFEHHKELNRKMSVLNGAINGCEELTSTFFKDFNELKVQTDKESTVIDIEPQPSGESNTSAESDDKDFFEETSEVPDTAWDRLLVNAALAREKQSVLRSKKILNHTITSDNENITKNLFESILLRSIGINVDSPSKRNALYKNMIEKVAGEIPIKKDED